MEFRDSLSRKELDAYRRDAKAADALRNGVFCLKRKQIAKAVWLVVQSIYYKPSYLFDKLKHNFKISK